MSQSDFYRTSKKLYFRLLTTRSPSIDHLSDSLAICHSVATLSYFIRLYLLLTTVHSTQTDDLATVVHPIVSAFPTPR